MTDNQNGRREISFACNVCGATPLERYRERSDRVQVLRCPRCGMGVVEHHPADLNVLYCNDYYGSSTEPQQGYSDYSYTAEHGLAWAASLIGLLSPNGRLLDIGCADGHLLDKLRSSHQCHGIEVSPVMAERCRSKGLAIIGSDIYDEALLPSYKSFFDVVCALAVFEHVRDFKRAVSIALDLLSPNGILLFEIPLISAEHPSDIWFQSSLEHVYYPSEKSVRYLFEQCLGLRLAGGETVIAAYGSTFVGLTSKNQAVAEALAKTYDKLVFGPVGQLNALERRFRFLFDVVHAANTSLEHIQLLRHVPAPDLNPALVQRLADLWCRDLDVSARFQSAHAQDQTKIEQLRNSAEQLQNSVEQLRGTIAEQARKIEIYDRSPWMRLRNAIMEERLSFRKLAKVAWLLALLAAPRSVRGKMETKLERIRPRVGRLRKALRFRKQVRKMEQQTKWPHDKPLMSVIIPCFNYGRYVEQAIDSVLAQTFQDFEIIVVDGGSTDPATLDTLRALTKPKTRVYFREGRHLVGDNRNFGIERACGKYICCLDADDKLRPTYFEKALFLLEHYHYDITSASVQAFEASTIHWNVPPSPSLDQIITGNQISTVAIFTKEMWKAANGYHDWGLGADHVFEDWDMFVRMMALGARAANIPERLMLYRVHGSGSLSQQDGVPPLARHAEKIREHNARLLEPRNYALSRRRNSMLIGVRNPNLNLATSFRKQVRKPRVLFALPFVITGGADEVLLQIADHLTRNGFDLSVITTIPTEERLGDNTPRYEAITKEVFHLYKFLRDEREWKDYLFYLIEAKGIDVLFIVGCAFVYDLLPELKRKFPRLKVVDQLFNEFGHIENNRKYANLIDLNVVASDALKDILTGRFGESEDKIKVIVHGVDVEQQFNPLLAADLRPVPENVIPQGKFVVTYVGRFSEEKCPEMFVDIADLLRKEQNLHFLMLGNGPEYLPVNEKICERELKDRIYAPGFVPDQRPFLLRSDVLVICSRIEGIPIVLMESLSLGVPVVASKVGGIPSVISEGYNGFLCDSSNPHGFAQAIKRIAGDIALHKVLRENARRYAVRHLSIASMKQNYLDVFTRLSGEMTGKCSVTATEEELLAESQVIQVEGLGREQ